jgi:hypothetical protein
MTTPVSSGNSFSTTDKVMIGVLVGATTLGIAASVLQSNDPQNRDLQKYQIVCYTIAAAAAAYLLLKNLDNNQVYDKCFVQKDGKACVSGVAKAGMQTIAEAGPVLATCGTGNVLGCMFAAGLSISNKV